MQNIEHFARNATWAIFKDRFNAFGAVQVKALEPQNTGSPLECAKAALVTYGLLALFSGASEAEIVIELGRVITSGCITGDVSPCIVPGIP